MFEKSRRKIVAAIMSVLVLLFLGTLIVIYSSSYLDVSSRNYDMLEHHAALYVLPEHLKDFYGEIPPNTSSTDNNNPTNKPDGHHFEDSPSFQLSTFYSVAVSNEDKVLAADSRGDAVYDKETLIKYASEILKSHKTKGIKGNLVFIVEEKRGYKLVAFMDNTVMEESMTTLFRYTLIFGSISIAALFFLALYLAGRIVKPLEESYQKQKQFISDAGHELKTPISVISANSELLETEIGSNRWLSNIQYENGRMKDLVIQLLELAKTENITLQTEKLNFSRLVCGETLPFESIAFEKGLMIDCNIEEDLYIYGNSTQLKQLVSILLDNAIDHSQNSGNVTIRLTEERNSVKLSVINNGKEIPPEKKKQLFERFYRIDTARSGNDKHYGLGLAIAKSIVLAHKGKIDVLCYDGRVEFAISLPLQKN